MYVHIFINVNSHAIICHLIAATDHVYVYLSIYNQYHHYSLHLPQRYTYGVRLHAIQEAVRAGGAPQSLLSIPFNTVSIEHHSEAGICLQTAITNQLPTGGVQHTIILSISYTVLHSCVR